MTKLAVISLLLISIGVVRWSVIPHSSQRYDTCGDWRWEGWQLHVTASALSHRRYELLILVHETVEALLCAVSGVSESNVTNFDVWYEAARADQSIKNPLKLVLARGRITDTSEPGDDYRAPYRTQHRIATAVERGLAFALLVNWDSYEREVESL